MFLFLSILNRPEWSLGACMNAIDISFNFVAHFICISVELIDFHQFTGLLSLLLG